jgi:L-threonylcarbamoyladenylate synthase
MSTTFELDPARPDEWSDGITAAAAALDAGGLVVLPTETVYGIASRPDLAEATDRLFAAKERPGTLNLPILAASPEEAWSIGVRSEQAGRLADRFWPGPLTLVLNRTDHSLPWGLGERERSVGVRVPRHAIATALLELTGSLAVTSANVSGEPPLADRNSLQATFGETASVILVLPPDAPPPGGASSTVVDLTQTLAMSVVGKAVILREGPISRNELKEVVGLLFVPPPTAPGSAPGGTR